MSERESNVNSTRRKFLTATGAAGVAVAAGCIGGSSDDDTISMVLNPAEDNVDIQLQYQPIIEYVEDEVDVTIETTRASDYTATIQEIERGSAEIADVGPFGAVAAQEVLDVIGIRLRFGSEKYFSLITTTPDSGIEELADLEGESIALGSRLSTSSGLFPLKMLADAGLDIGDAPEGDAADFDANFTGDHITPRQQLINRDEIVAATTGAFSTAPHVPQEQFEQMSEEFVNISAEYEGAGERDPELQLLAVSDPIPRAPLVSRSDWDSDVRSDVEDAFVNAPDEAFQHDPEELAEELGVDPSILEKDEEELTEDEQEQLNEFEDNQLWFDDIVEADFSAFDPVESVQEQLGIDPGELG